MLPSFAPVHWVLWGWIQTRSTGYQIKSAFRSISYVVLLAWVALGQVAGVHAQAQTDELSNYPRPFEDNGWGVHWAPTLLTQPQETVDHYLSEVDALGLRWLKLMQPDQAQLEHQYLLAQLVQRGIEPVLRIQKPYNDPYDNLESLVLAGIAAGINYYELYNNPNVAGLEGGWRRGEAIDVAQLVQRWVVAARTVRAAGGYPGLPSLSPNGAVADTEFLRRFLHELSTLDALDALDGTWLPVQNYMGNRPLDDPNGFSRFETYHQIVQEITGRTLPILSTEGGAIVGDNQDSRYPPLTDDLVADHTVAAFQFMEHNRPAYFFAFMPWLLVNADAGGYNNSWEAHAWFPVGDGPRPVVAALKAISPHQETPRHPVVPQRDLQYTELNSAQPLPQGMPTDTAADVQTAETGMRPLNVAPTDTSEVAATSATRALSVGKVSVSEGSLVLPTYDYEAAYVPTEQDDPIWPAPRLDPTRVGSPTPQSYRTIVLENDYLRLTFLPELGGRLYRWEDKLSNRDILYYNSVVKPTRWGVRGWWLGVGGMEWAFPLPDHGLYEYQPWRAETITDQNAAAVRLSHNGPGGLEVTITVGLSADARFFAVTPELRNTSGESLSTHFWINAMLAPGQGNSINPNSRLVWPADDIVIHSSAGSRSVPMGATFSWPDGNGQDLGLLANWPQHLSFFANEIPRQGAAGLVDGDSDLAIIRAFPLRTAPGLKTFYGPNLDPTLWTDGDDRRFFELWGGASRNFDTPVQLAPQTVLRWTEQWYTVPELGEFVAANAHVALALHPEDGGTELRLASTGSAAMRSIVTQLVVRVDGNIIFDEAITLSADALFRQSLPEQVDGHQWVVQLIDGQNRVIFAYDNRSEPPAEPSIPADPIEWDTRLDELNVAVVPATVRSGQSYWKVIKAEFQTPEEGGGRHHIYIEVLDETGKRIVGQKVEIGWQDGSAIIVTEDKPEPEYAANFPMYSDLGGYSAAVPGLSDTVVGMGLPWGRTHVVYNIVFQKTVKK